jgi:uncharacterized repeat protein (TIGR03803 family)
MFPKHVLLVSAAGTLLLAACGGGGYGSGAAAQSYTVGGSVSGLTTTGLMLANGADTVSVPTNATSFTLPTSVTTGTAYAVTVKTQPTHLTCTVNNGSGTMGSSAVTNVAVSCVPAATYQVGGTIMGLTARGLVLLDNGGDATTIAANAAQFTMNTRVASGGSYAITVMTQPTGATCTVSNGSGSNLSGNVTSVAISCAPSGTFTETVLHSFAGGSSDGSNPYADLIELRDGNFYGTTVGGGANGIGTVFRITAAGVETVLYSFAGGSDGSSPQAGLIDGSDGNFYGTTELGGLHNLGTGQNRGTVFRITPAGMETVLYSFAGSDGSHPYAGLMQGSDGNLYGTTSIGGANGLGTVFQITRPPASVETVLHSFAGGSDGSSPQAGLIQGDDGIFYGTTFAGGAHNLGTVFRITPAGRETVLHSFTGSDGAHPYAGLIQGSDGNLYGTTSIGGANGLGTVFQITPAGVETVLHSFAGGSDGSEPYAGLIEGSDGNFYGTTELGGLHNLGTGQNRGTVFRITPAGRETVLYSFAGGSDGSEPYAGLIEGSDGNFYGTTSIGGANNAGTVFKLVLH